MLLSFLGDYIKTIFVYFLLFSLSIRFAKKLKVSNPQLIDLIRRKVKLNQPYVGVFMKKDNDNEAEIVEKLDDVYKVGTFAQILELQDLGDKLRMVVVAHRRIKITGQIMEELVPPKGMFCAF